MNFLYVSRKKAIIGFFIFVAIFLIYRTVHEQSSEQSMRHELHKHASILANYLWQFDEEGTRSYLDYASKLERYSSAKILDFTGNEFARATPLLLSKGEKTFHSIGLLSESPLEIDIIQEDRTIGKLSVVQLQRESFLYSYIILVMILLFLVFLFIDSLYNTNRSLEKIVLQKTAAHRESETRLRALLNSITDGIVAIKHDGVVVLANPVAEALLLPDQPLINANIFEELVFTSLDNMPIELSEFLQKSQRRTVKRINPVTKNEQILTISSAPIATDAQSHDGYVFIFRDVTAHIKMEEQLRHTEKMESVGKLAGGIAHDFNNMLSGILGAAELIEWDLDPESQSELKENVALIKTSATMAADLTKKLLRFSRKEQPKKELLTVRAIISETLMLLTRSVDKRITIIENQECNDSILCSRSQIENALLNLAINARDAIKESGTITLSTDSVVITHEQRGFGFPAKPGAYARIRVIDSGFGMTEDTMNKIFEPFFTTKEMGKGTGLGLAAVYGTIMEHQGGITVESTIGMGTTFTIMIPLAEQMEAPTIEKLPTATSAMPQQRTILVVDDEESMRIVVGKTLKKQNYRIITALNGQEAVDLIKKGESPALILMDYIMPVMNGHEAYRAIRAINPVVPVIIMSGYLPESKEKLLADGVTAVIDKPFSAELLRQVLSSHILAC